MLHRQSGTDVEETKIGGTDAVWPREIAGRAGQCDVQFQDTGAATRWQGQGQLCSTRCVTQPPSVRDW